MNLGFPEMVFLVILAFMLFGPKRLPEIARQLGKFVAEFKKASNDFQSQIHQEIRKLELDDVDPRKHLEPEVAKLSQDEDLSLTGALNRLTDRIKNTVPQDYDA
ncbi:MAG TPA: twin-arginine translocase TatA/TatE family subunit [Candidatus Angelobacter sp.]|jgi:Tat protein translocase TatB subunit|nr:twin-arginine translocase TatA/TatE family subunit [Candidatus Angelobacter sp.]